MAPETAVVFRVPSQIEIEKNKFLTLRESFMYNVQKIPVLTEDETSTLEYVRIKSGDSVKLCLSFTEPHVTIVFHEDGFLVPEVVYRRDDARTVTINALRNFRGEPLPRFSFHRNGPRGFWKFIQEPPLDIWALDALISYILCYVR